MQTSLLYLCLFPLQLWIFHSFPILYAHIMSSHSLFLFLIVVILLLCLYKQHLFCFYSALNFLCSLHSFDRRHPALCLASHWPPSLFLSFSSLYFQCDSLCILPSIFFLLYVCIQNRWSHLLSHLLSCTELPTLDLLISHILCRVLMLWLIKRLCWKLLVI